MLRSLGCDVELAEDGEAACAAAASDSFDPIFMDCHMPGVDGFEAARRIREDGLCRGTRVSIVALTADALAGDRERCLASGMDDYMTKPVSTVQLASAIRRWAARRQ